MKKTIVIFNISLFLILGFCLVTQAKGYSIIIELRNGDKVNLTESKLKMKFHGKDAEEALKYATGFFEEVNRRTLQGKKTVLTPLLKSKNSCQNLKASLSIPCPKNIPQQVFNIKVFNSTEEEKLNLKSGELINGTELLSAPPNYDHSQIGHNGENGDAFAQMSDKEFDTYIRASELGAQFEGDWSTGDSDSKLAQAENLQNATGKKFDKLFPAYQSLAPIPDRENHLRKLSRESGLSLGSADK